MLRVRVKKNIFSVQENDRTTIFEQYREATNELTRAKMTLADVESQIGNLKQELQIKSSDTKRLTERIDYLERELQQVNINFFFFLHLKTRIDRSFFSTCQSIKSTSFNFPI